MLRKPKKEKKPFRLLTQYIDYVATEISYLFLLTIAVFALLIVSLTGYSLPDDTKYLIYALIASGFAFMALSWYKRKELEKRLE